MFRAPVILRRRCSVVKLTSASFRLSARDSYEDGNSRAQYCARILQSSIVCVIAASPRYPNARAAGNAITVLTHPGDNWTIHVAVEHCQRGDLLVIAISSECSDGFFGELLATSYKARGVCGLVLDACCRDVREIIRMQFSIWSKASPQRAQPRIRLASTCP